MLTKPSFPWRRALTKPAIIALVAWVVLGEQLFPWVMGPFLIIYAVGLANAFRVWYRGDFDWTGGAGPSPATVE